MKNQLKNKEYSRLIKIAGYLIILCTITFHLFSCNKMTDNYKQYLAGGEIIYPGKVDSVKVFPGKYRIGLSWLILSDRSIISATVFWNNGKDSTIVPINRTSGIDTINIVLNNLLELPYTFYIVTNDAMGNRSVKTEVIGTVYGDMYRGRLLNRAILGLVYSETKGLNVKWATADEGTVGEEIVYTDIDGNSHSIICNASLNEVWLEKYDPSLAFKYKTAFIPDSMAIDTFKTEFADINPNIKKLEKEVNKSLFSLYVLPGDYSVPSASSTTVDLIWTNQNAVINSPSYISVVSGHPMPQWFTIDIGAKYELTKMKLFQRGAATIPSSRLYAGGNLRSFEVWGSLNPDVNYNPDDHSGNFGTSWVLLQTCVINRPSGNIKPTAATRNDNTQQDIDAAIAGHEFTLNVAGSFRYIRIKGIENWDSANKPYVNIASVAFWAMQY